jgi:hypothetical protein
MPFGFIISTSIRTNIHLNQLHRCISSVKKYHPDNDIIIINDSNDNYNLEIELKKYDKLHIIKSLKKGSGDQQTFKVLSETNLFDKAVILQDSMLLNKKLENIDEINSVMFLWHFTNHRVHWNNIREPTSQYNIDNNIITHTDLIAHHVLTYYNAHPSFQIFALKSLLRMDKWCGCFGPTCIIDKETLLKLNKEVNLIDIFPNSTSNRDRRTSESIFALICHYVFPNIDFENSYDGLYYDGNDKVNLNLSGTATGFDDLKWFKVRNYFSKIAFNRV